jgi:hypothetical protein
MTNQLPVTGYVQALLEHLPTATVNLSDMPHEMLRGLCEAFRIEITYDRAGKRAHYSAQIGADTPRLLDGLEAEPYVRVCDVPSAGPALHAKTRPPALARSEPS